MSPVPMKTTRMCALNVQARHGRSAAGPACCHALRHQFLTGRDFTLADRGSAPGAEIIVNLLIRQDEEEPLTDRHRSFALIAVEA